MRSHKDVEKQRRKQRPRSRSRSRSRDRERRRRRSSGEERRRNRSRERDRDRREDSRRRRDRDDRHGNEPEDSFPSAATNVKEDPDAASEKQAPSFEVSGKLLEDTNTFQGVVIKYSEPPEAKKPKKRWRLYVFKGEEELPILHIHRQSAFLLGKDRKIADLPIDHPSCSRQHAVLQYRMIKRDGGSRVLPYIIDLGSSNGTFLNNQKIEPRKYYELREKDVLKFGYSSREYVLLHDSSRDSGDA